MRIFFATILLILSQPVAAYIVDTGPGQTGFVGGALLANASGTSGVAQFLAGQFTTDRDWIVTGIEGWMSQVTSGESATAKIYTVGPNNLGIGPGETIFSAAFEAGGDDVDARWVGIRGLNWLLPAGTYYVGFEVAPDQTMDATMPQQVPNPMDLYAYYLMSNDGWVPSDQFTIGFRVDATAVPLPGAILLVLSGVLTLGWLKQNS